MTTTTAEATEQHRSWAQITLAFAVVAVASLLGPLVSVAVATAFAATLLRRNRVAGVLLVAFGLLFPLALYALTAFSLTSGTVGPPVVVG